MGAFVYCLTLTTLYALKIPLWLIWSICSAFFYFALIFLLIGLTTQQTTWGRVYLSGGRLPRVPAPPHPVICLHYQYCIKSVMYYITIRLTCYCGCLWVSISDDGVELRVRESDVHDTAVYSCVARNLAGEMEKTFSVDVHSRFMSHSRRSSLGGRA